MTQLDLSPALDLPNDKLEALVEMMFLAAYADEEFSDEEQAHFKTSLQSLTDQRLQGQALDDMLARCATQLAEAGRAARLTAVKERLPDERVRKVALQLALQVMAADGIIRTSEREMILETAEALELDTNEVAELVRRFEPAK